MNIGAHQISCGRLIVRAGNTQSTNARVLAGTATVNPEIPVVSKGGEPCALVLQKGNVRRSEKRGEVAPTARRKGVAAIVSKKVCDQRAARLADLCLPKRMVLV